MDALAESPFLSDVSTATASTGDAPLASAAVDDQTLASAASATGWGTHCPPCQSASSSPARSAGDESTNDGYVLILGGDAAIKRYWGFQDLTYEVYDAQYGELPPPAAFDTCLAAELAWERASCLFSLGLIPPFVVCDEGWSQSLL